MRSILVKHVSAFSRILLRIEFIIMHEQIFIGLVFASLGFAKYLYLIGGTKSKKSAYPYSTGSAWLFIGWEMNSYRPSRIKYLIALDLFGFLIGP